MNRNDWNEFFDKLHAGTLTIEDVRSARNSASDRSNPCVGDELPETLANYFERVEWIVDFSRAIHLNDWESGERIFETSCEKWTVSDRKAHHRNSSPHAQVDKSSKPKKEKL